MDWLEQINEFKYNDEVGNGLAGVPEAWDTLKIASEHLEEIKNLPPKDLICTMDAIQIATNIISINTMKRIRELSKNPISSIDLTDPEFKL